MRRFAIAIVAGCIGLGAFLWAFPAASPSMLWRCETSGSELIARARNQAAAMGLNAASWSAYLTHNRTSNIDAYVARNPEESRALTISSISAKVLLAENDQKWATVLLNPSGGVEGWDFSRAGLPPASAAPRTVADEAFRVLCADHADIYALVTDGAQSRDGVRYTWERKSQNPEAVQLSIEVLIRDGRAVKANRNVKLSAAFESTLQRDVPVLSLAGVGFVVIGAPLLVLLYVLGSVRRRFRQNRVLLASLAVALAFMALSAAGSSRIEAITEAYEKASTAWWTFGALAAAGLGLALLFLVGAGSTLWISASRPTKIQSFVALLSGGFFDRSVGTSALAGFCYAPLLAAIPFVARALFDLSIRQAGGLAGNPMSVDSAVLYSPTFLLEIFTNVDSLFLLGFFGVLVPLLFDKIRNVWLLRLAIILLGTVAAQLSVTQVRGPWWLGAVMSTAALGVYMLLYSQFDLLAVLISRFAVEAIGNLSAVAVQPSMPLRESAEDGLLLLVGLTVAAGLVAWRGRASTLETETVPLPADHSETERERLRMEFGIAQRAQREMLPSKPPSWPGYTVAASCDPAKDVGGDLYDFLKLPDGRWGVCVADVSGKGVPAALYMTLTKGVLAAVTQDSSDLAPIVTAVNTHVHAVARRKIFVTMAMGALDLENRTMEYARAGHNPIVWRRIGVNETTLLTPPGLGLGITGGSAFQRTLRTQSLQLESGDALVFYSDGLTEAMNATGEQYGEERLLAAVHRTDGMDAAATRESIIGDVFEFLQGVHPQDDLTVVVIRVGDHRAASLSLR